MTAAPVHQETRLYGRTINKYVYGSKDATTFNAKHKPFIQKTKPPALMKTKYKDGSRAFCTCDFAREVTGYEPYVQDDVGPQKGPCPMRENGSAGYGTKLQATTTFILDLANTASDVR